MITKGQRIMLFGLWKQAKGALMKGRETWTGEEERRRRIEFTQQAIGRNIESWNELNPRSDVDLLIASLVKVIDPTDLNAQLRQLGQEHKRAMFRVNQLMAELGKDRNFVNGVIQQIEAGVDPNDQAAAWEYERERTGRSRTLEELTVPELKKVIDALRSIQRRESKKPGRDYFLNKQPRTYAAHTA